LGRVKITAVAGSYEEDLLRLFHEAKEAGCLLPGDALWNDLEERNPEDTENRQFGELWKMVQPIWDAWLFYCQH
jgi:hypothetical protein